MARFKTRARAIDMLGRQQISGLPTAISELFKNGYDAYADIVQADYFKHLNIFVLRDDGYGMTKVDFEEKWLALGSDSKYNKVSKNHFLNKEIRPVLGEKGIGRLAISTLGPQVLIMSRAYRDDKLQDLVLSYIHWGIFELPGINLEDIEIPIKTFKLGEVPQKEDITNLISTFKNNLSKVEKNLDKEMHNKFIQHFKRMEDLSVMSAWESILEEPSLVNHSGTQFIIAPCDEMLKEELKDLDDYNSINSLKRSLLGFYNTMTKSPSEQKMKTVFNIHLNPETKFDMLYLGKFWTEEEFDKTDIYIKGSFDETGCFKGQVRLYDKVIEYTTPCLSSDSYLNCGKFKFTLGFLQGLEKDSLLKDDEFIEYKQKIDSLGSIYIYKDDIRILPYGNPEFDFLKLELERTKRASDFIFSHRRLFSAVELTNEHNYNLKEKAGREGFIENKAYKQFKEVLLSLLKQIMKDFILDNSNDRKSDYYIEKKEEINEDIIRKKLLKEEEQRQRKIINNFKKDFTPLYQKLKSINYKKISEEVYSNYDSKFNNFLEMQTKDLNKLWDLKFEGEKIYKDYIVNYEVIKKPYGVSFSKSLEEDYEDYCYYLEKLKNTLGKYWAKYNNIIDNQVVEYSNTIDSELDNNVLIDKQIQAIEKIEDLKNIKREEIYNVLGEMIDGVINKSMISYDVTLKDIKDLLKAVKSKKISQQIKLQNEYVKKIDNLNIEINDIYEKILYSIKSSIKLDDNKKIMTSSDLLEAYQSEIKELEISSDSNMEIFQKGLALEYISHEFSPHIRIIREELNRLKAWGDANPKLKNIHYNIDNSFSHLDGYLVLLTKLQKRNYRTQIEITGAKIFDFIKNVFEERIDSKQIELTCSDTFKNTKVYGYPSTFYPVFMNLVDNSIYWLTKSNNEDRVIHFDCDNDGNFIVSDNGPGVDVKYELKIFDRGFSRKDDGRGLGLYISKHILQEESHDIIYLPRNAQGATFKIIVNCEI